jgi:hypothetical protein
MTPKYTLDMSTQPAITRYINCFVFDLASLTLLPQFAITVDPDNQALKKLGDYAAANRETQGKFTIGDEKVCPVYIHWNSPLTTAQKHNVFMRLSDPQIQKATGTTREHSGLLYYYTVTDTNTEELDTMSKLREMKNAA